MQKNYSCEVEGMTCGNCALTISRLLEKKGATQIAANAASGSVTFTLDETQDVDNLYNAIDALGYHVVRGDHSAEEAHEHSHNQSSLFLFICLGLTLPLLGHMFLPWPWLHLPWLQFALSTPVFLIGVYVFGPGAIRSVKHGLPNMDVLIMLGASAAYVYSLTGLLFFGSASHQYIFFETAASIITLVMVGNWLEHKTVQSTTVAIDALVSLQPQEAKIVMTDSLGKETIMKVEAKFIRVGDTVLANTGDSIPSDGTVVSGEAFVDEKMITGEPDPERKQPGDKVVGGTIISNGSVKISVTETGASTVLSGIIKMIREAQAAKPRLQKLADKISAIFVPLVFGISLLTFLINYFATDIGFAGSMMRSIAVMVISCPCAMGLATPAAIAVGLGRSARRGILIKGGDTLEEMKSVRQIVFDKTGTLTTGNLTIGEYEVTGMEEREFKAIVYALEKHSSHPIAVSVVRAWQTYQKDISFSSVAEIKGKGMEARDNEGNIWRLGSGKWLAAHDERDFDLYLFRNDERMGGLSLSDEIRPDAKSTLEILRSRGYRMILLSGDKKRKCEELAAQLGIREVWAEQSPAQKNEVLDKLLKDAPTAMVGDGINDAPALTKATVGVSLSDASHIAINSANIILSNNKLSSLPDALQLGIYTEQTIRQNLFWAFFYNVIAIPVAAVGLLTPTWGAGIMALSDVVLVLNSLRLGVRRLN